MEKFDIGEFIDSFNWITYTGDIVSLPTADKENIRNVGRRTRKGLENT